MSKPLENRQARGLCAVCGHEVSVTGHNRLPRPHNARRVRRGADGQPEIFMAENCAGSAEPAEPLAAQLTPVFATPMSGAR